MNLTGPLPADTLYSIPKLTGDSADAVLAMYHDQGLPVLKFKGFGKAVNITLGLPIIRTSVDHGTALDLAGTGKAESRQPLYSHRFRTGNDQLVGQGSPKGGARHTSPRTKHSRAVLNKTPACRYYTLSYPII